MDFNSSKNSPLVKSPINYQKYDIKKVSIKYKHRYIIYSKNDKSNKFSSIIKRRKCFNF